MTIRLLSTDGAPARASEPAKLLLVLDGELSPLEANAMQKRPGQWCVTLEAQPDQLRALAAVAAGMAERPKLTPLLADTLKFYREREKQDGEPPTVTDVAVHFGITKPSAGERVRTLVRKGYLAVVDQGPRRRYSAMALKGIGYGDANNRGTGGPPKRRGRKARAG